MTRVPLLAGSGVTVLDAEDDALVLRPPPPGTPVDVRAAVRDALRFPLRGPSLAELATRGGTATIVLELPALPVPGAADDPRLDALDAAVSELERAGVPLAHQTILVATGLFRRPGPNDLASLVHPEFRRRFRGRVAVHDVEGPELVDVGRIGDVPLRVHPALVNTDLVLVLSAAETVLDGGPGALLRAANAEALRAARSVSLLRARDADGWRLGVELERALGERVPLIAASIVLDLPRVGGVAHGYPYDDAALERISASTLRRAFAALPQSLRHRSIVRLPRSITAAAAFGGPPSVAHAEALLRAIDRRSLPLERPLDAVVVGVPPTTAALPRELPNPVSAVFLALGLALRLWRGTFPVAEDGTAILVHPLRRRFPHPTQHPFRALFGSQLSREPDALEAAERAARSDEAALDAYRGGRTCHPLLPFAEWDACRPALDRLGAVLVAGCRDATAARQLGLVPVHGTRAALAMAHGRAGGRARVGILLSPPYFPLRLDASAGAGAS